MANLKYGELVVIGSENEQMSSIEQRRFSLRRAEAPTAVMPSRVQTLPIGQAAQQLQQQGSKEAAVSYASGDRDFVVSFTSVLDKDMFQIGRAMSTRNQLQLHEFQTVSRYACRIVVNRAPPFTARIFAGGFNEKNRIFLGPNATANTNGDNDQFDALITNGVLILHPPPSGIKKMTSSDIANWTPRWREVSISGKLYKCKENRAKPDMQNDLVTEETNQLIDGTIIDLGGVFLLWRSHEACEAFSDDNLKDNIKLLNEMHNVCPVHLQTLIIKKLPRIQPEHMEPVESDPCAFMECGHVFSGGMVETDIGQGREKCPVCRNDSPSNKLFRLKLGDDSRVYVDGALPKWVFKPCGHIASEMTAKFWGKIKLRLNGVEPIHACPFCMTPLSESSPIGQIYLQNVDRN